MTVLSPLPVQKFFDSNGRPLVGGKLFTYEAGTSNKVATFVDSDGVSQNTNPIILDYRGEANIWLDVDLAYKFVLAPATDSDPPANPIWTVDNIRPGVTVEDITAQFLGMILWPRTTAEINAGVTPVYYYYPPGDLRRYGADITGANDSTNAINDALAAATATDGIGYVYHPGGSILHDSTITVPNQVRIFGEDNAACEFVYSGTGSGWNNVNTPISGFALVYFDKLKFRSTSNSNTGAAIELNAGGWSYYGVTECWITGKWKYGVILDATEITFVNENIIDISGPSSQIGIWIVNGGDRIPTQSAGFSNGIEIIGNQISQNGGVGFADDGGNCHTVDSNLFNECNTSATLAKMTDSSFCNNSMESSHEIGVSNVLFTDIGVVSGATKGPCFGVVVESNTFSQNMNSSGACLRFGGASMHQAISVRCNNFVDLLGRGAAIDVTKLGNSFCGYNHDDGTGGMSHYINVHNDADGNTLLPPQNGFPGTLGITGPTYGDTRYTTAYKAAVGLQIITVTYSASMTINASQGNTFVITATNNTAFTINNPTNATTGQEISIVIRNTSGGALGAVTWGTDFKQNAASPANGNSRTTKFINNGTNWVQSSGFGTDIPN